MTRLLPLLALVFLICAGCQHHAPPREFRAVWVATVGNIDWPSKPGLSVEDQQREALAILDTARGLHLNAVVFQVRPACDALYKSDLEPWSYFLTGAQGKAPEPFYDPLEFWVREAHARGLELHAWFNPFRAGHPGDRSPRAANHVSQTHPEYFRQYGEYGWLDPASDAARAHSLAVMLDVVKRYDIDGVHMDDYFYPYPIKAPAPGSRRGGAAPAASSPATAPARELDFPDDEAWQKYVAAGGTLDRADWRRDHINTLVHNLYDGVKATKPTVKVGLSPFGIWKPGNPPGVEGFNQYEKLYADAKLWLNNGWVDYYTPQLYWKVSSPKQPYGPLLNWWVSQNTHAREIYPGLFTSKVGESASKWEPQEILDQIQVTRDTPGAQGHVHFSMKVLSRNTADISKKLLEGPYASAAVIPQMKWLPHANSTSQPLEVSVHEGVGSIAELGLRWTAAPVTPFYYLIGIQRDGVWAYDTALAADTSWRFHESLFGARPTRFSIASVDRAGNVSDAVVVDVPQAK